MRPSIGELGIRSSEKPHKALLMTHRRVALSAQGLQDVGCTPSQTQTGKSLTCMMLPTTAVVKSAMQLSASGGLTFDIALRPGDWFWLCPMPPQHLLDLRTERAGVCEPRYAVSSSMAAVL